jgi:hypothetical protein
VALPVSETPSGPLSPAKPSARPTPEPRSHVGTLPPAEARRAFPRGNAPPDRSLTSVPTWERSGRRGHPGSCADSGRRVPPNERLPQGPAVPLLRLFVLRNGPASSTSRSLCRPTEGGRGRSLPRPAIPARCRPLPEYYNDEISSSCVGVPLGFPPRSRAGSRRRVPAQRVGTSCLCSRGFNRPEQRPKALPSSFAPIRHNGG